MTHRETRHAQALAQRVDWKDVFEQERSGFSDNPTPSAETISSNESALTAFAFTRAVLSLIIVGSVILGQANTTNPDAALILVTFFLVAGIGLYSAIRTLSLVYKKRLLYAHRPWALILLDAALAIGVMAVIDAETSPLAWVALIAPVLETAVLFSMVPAGLVWVGLSLAFLAMRLTTGLADEPTSDTIALAVQQVFAVLLVSGPAALLSDSTQQRMDTLADARRGADQIADRLRRIAQAASDMSQENSVESVLASVSHSAVTIGFDHADVVIRNSDGTLGSHGSHSTGQFRLPPLELLSHEAVTTSIRTISATSPEHGQLLHRLDLSSGHAVQISSTDGDDESSAVLRVWSKRRESTDQELRALSLLAGHAREIHRAAELLAAAKAHSDQLLHEVRHDGLTGLANRAFVLSTLEERIAAGSKTALFFMDLDGFKEINDTLGHRAGDAALITVAERLRDLERQGALAGRMGGDEFIIIVPITVFDTLDGLANFGRAIVEAISVPMVVDGHQAHLGASIGLAVHAEGLDADHLISLADNSMYKAKRSGGGLQISESTEADFEQPLEGAS